MPEEAAAAVLEAPASTAVEIVAEPTTELSPVSEKPAVVDPTKPLDKRNNPDALRKTLKWLEENGGEHSTQANEIRKNLGENKSYKTVYPTVREARESKMALDAVGGVAKIAELQQNAAKLEELDGLVEAGDFAGILKLVQGDLSKIAPGLLDHIKASSPEAYQSAVKPHAVGFMDSEGLPEAIDSMVAAFNANEPLKAADILKRIVAWYKGIAVPGKEAAKPAGQQAWEKERDEMHAKVYATEVNTVFSSVIAHAEGELDKYLRPEAKRLGITDPEAYDLLRQDAWKEVLKRRDADAIFKSTFKSKVNSDRKKISADAAQFYNSYTDRFAKEAADRAIRVRYGFVKPASATIDPAKKQSPTAAPVGGNAQVDHVKMRAVHGRDGAMNEIMAGRALDKAGKKLVQQGKVWKYA